MKLRPKNQAGFTLIEAMVAIVVLAIGVIGPLSLAARGISDGLFAQNQLTANFLAQEAIETIINQRNTNLLEDPTLPPFRNILFVSGGGDYNGQSNSNLRVNGPSGEITNNCDASSGNLSGGCYLSYDANSQVYVNNSSGGQFFRKISVAESDKTIDGIANVDELAVTVTIKWKNKNLDKDFTVTEYIYGK